MIAFARFFKIGATFLTFHKSPLRAYFFLLKSITFLRAKAATAIARLSYRNSVRLSVRLSVCHTGGSGKNGPS